jgi:hypothetical protein
VLLEVGEVSTAAHRSHTLSVELSYRLGSTPSADNNFYTGSDSYISISKITTIGAINTKNPDQLYLLIFSPL